MINKKYMKRLRQTAFNFSPETEKKLLELTLAESKRVGRKTDLVDIVRKLIDDAHKLLKK